MRTPHYFHDLARRLRSEGKTTAAIAKEIGVSETTVRRIVTDHPDSRRVANGKNAERRDDRAEAAKLMRKIPNDTRSLTARLFGDPLPGRSAADTQATS